MTSVQAGMVYETLAAGRPGVNCEQIILTLTDPALAGNAGLSLEAALRQAWARAFERHAGLRMRFTAGGESEAGQRPEPAASAFAETGLTLLDFSSAPDCSSGSDPEARFTAWAVAERARGADPGSWPGQRLHLARLGAEVLALVWTFPHALLDGRSFTLVLREVLQDLQALLAGQALPERVAAPDPAPHYLAARAAAADPGALAFFARHLQGCEAAAVLPGPGLLPAASATPLPEALSSRSLMAALSEADTLALSTLASGMEATLFTLVNAAWGLVLARSSGKAAAVFGTTRTGRHLTPESRDLVGCLINTLPLALRISPGDTLGALIGRLRADQLAMRRFEHATPAAIRQALIAAGEVAPGEAAQPLFETIVMAERQSLEASLQAGNSALLRRVELREEGALPLTLAVYGGPSLELQLEYDPRRFSAAEAGQCLAWLQNLLESCASARPGTPLAQLSMLSRAERDWLQLCAVPPDELTAAEPPPEQRIAARAAEDPDRPALLCAGESSLEGLSRGALELQAGVLARQLVARGIGPGQVVALSLPRGPGYVAALLAVWKAGAAFLPLDPGWPVERLEHMLTDSGAALLLCAAGSSLAAGAGAVATLDPAELLVPVPDGAEAAAGPAAAVTEADAEAATTGAGVAAAAGPEDPAYLLYTSGSTGLPKGVVVPRRAIAAHCSAAIALFGLTPADRVLQFTSLSFDVSLEEILPALSCGALLCLRSEAAGQDPRQLLAQIEAQGITVLNLPTGYWQALLEDLAQSGRLLPASVRLVIAGGERVPAAALRRWRALLPDLAWINGYGPTEATITSAAFLLAPGAAVPAGDVPVGRPLAHSRLYVLAADGSPAPPGAPGQLWIGGQAVAQGYLRQPELSAARFRPDPQNPAPGARIYDSGDLARWGADRQLALGGRADRQIKLRGYRIEPGEIEQLIEAVSGVTQALVGLVDPGLPEARLLAWLRGTPGADGRMELPEAAILAALQHLPAPLRPELVPVSDWPLRPGGKTDIARLPRPRAPAVPAALSRRTGAGHALPADPLTRRLAGHFGAVLAQPGFGADQDFFRQGGHSLLLIRLMARIEASEAQRISVADLHQNSTPRKLAAHLASGEGNLASESDFLMPIQPLGTRTPIYGVHVLGLNGSYYRPLAAQMGPDQPIFGLTVGLLNEATPVGVEETAALYQRVIEAHQPEGRLALMAVSLGSYIALELARRLIASGREVQMLALIDATGPGGRPSIGTLARLARHFSALRQQGLGYASRKLAERLDGLRHHLAKLRLAAGRWLSRHRLSQRGGAAAGDGARQSASIADFVAANALAIESWSPAAYPGRLSVIRATGNISDSEAAITTGLGWAPVAAGGFEVFEVEGDHLTILAHPGVAELAQVLSAILEGSASTAAPQPARPDMPG
nr:amino acid adenylation domain-containing protein [Pseudogemmobacter faecipullorum]